MIPIRFVVTQTAVINGAGNKSARATARLVLPGDYDWTPNAGNDGFWHQVARDIIAAAAGTGLDPAASSYDIRAYNASVADCENAERAIIRPDNSTLRAIDGRNAGQIIAEASKRRHMMATLTDIVHQGGCDSRATSILNDEYERLRNEVAQQTDCLAGLLMVFSPGRSGIDAEHNAEHDARHDAGGGHDTDQVST